LRGKGLKVAEPAGPGINESESGAAASFDPFVPGASDVQRREGGERREGLHQAELHPGTRPGRVRYPSMVAGKPPPRRPPPAPPFPSGRAGSAMAWVDRRSLAGG
jgi:hypothetical protein